MYYNNILETIGNTPLVKINTITKDIPGTFLAKLDFFNPGNSIKDRIDQWKYRYGFSFGCDNQRL